MTTKLSAGQIALLNQNELDDFVKKNVVNDNNTRNISNIVNWEDLSKPKRDLTAKRLLSAVQRITAPSSLDAERLAKLLAQIPSDRSTTIQDTPTCHPSFSRSPTIEPPENEVEEYERKCYQALLDVGFRPLFHISLLPQVLADPDAYHDLLRPWTRYPDTHAEDSHVFSRQLRRCQEFKSWQLANRQQILAFSEYLDEKRRDFERIGGAAGRTAQPDFEEAARRRWEREYGSGQPQQDNDDGDDAEAAFSKYVDAATRLLMDNGFVQPFQLQADAKQQDQWTTFVEYLAFECYWLGRRARSAQSLRLKHDAMWEELVEADVVMPLDLASSEVEAMRCRELERAARAVRSFTAATSTTATDRAEKTLTQMTQHPRYRGRGDNKLPSHAQHSLQPAQMHLDDITSSRDLLDRYHDFAQKYRIAKAEADSQERRVEWVWSEISKIGEEQKAAGKRKLTHDPDVESRLGNHRRTDETEEMMAGKDNASRTTRSKKRKLPTDDDVPEPHLTTEEKIVAGRDNGSRTTRSKRRKLLSDHGLPERKLRTEEKKISGERDGPRTRSRKRVKQEQDGIAAPVSALGSSLRAGRAPVHVVSAVTTEARPRRQPWRSCRGTIVRG